MMKTSRLLLVVAFILFAVSCKKDEAGMKTDTTATDSGLSADEVANLTVNSIAANSLGFAAIANDVTANAVSMNNISTDGGKTINAIDPNTLYQKCGSTVLDSTSNHGTISSVTFSSFYKYARTLNCTTGNIGTNVVNKITYTGTVNAPNLTSNDSGTSTVTITGLAATATQYTLSGTYTRKSIFTMKQNYQTYKAVGNITLTTNNVVFSKPGGLLVSGTASAVVSVVSSVGTFKYTGIFKFIGNNQATLTMNDKSVYKIDLVTGYFARVQ